MRGTEAMTRRADPLASRRTSARSRSPRGSARASSASWIDRFGFGEADRGRLPGRELGPRAPAREVVGLDDRHRADRPGHRRDAAADGRPPTPRSGTAACGVTPHLVEKVGAKRVPARRGTRVVSTHTADRMMAMFRDVVLEGTGTAGRDPRLHASPARRAPRRRPSTARYVDQVRRVVRRARPGQEPAARDPRDGRRAARRHLRRRRRRTRVPRHRAVRPPVPRGAARRARDEDVADRRRRRSRPVVARRSEAGRPRSGRRP